MILPLLLAVSAFAQEYAPPVSQGSGLVSPPSKPSAVALSAPALASGAPDEDGDGLSDAAEAELAQAFRPYIVFDSHEKSTKPGEPVTVFQVRPLGCAGPRAKCKQQPLRVRITYVLMWEMDGGYGPASWCRDKHIGDTQPVDVLVGSADDGVTFEIEKLTAWGFSWPKDATQFLGGRHFALYASSGKHHYFLGTTYDGKRSPYSKWGCSENVDGKGPAYVVVLAGNAGEHDKHPSPPFVDDLTPHGFKGEGAWKAAPFCGGLPCRADNPTSKNADLWSKEAFSIP